MSRAVNVNATPEAVKALCLKHDILISTVEALQSGGSRVVLNTSVGAAAFRTRMRDQLLTGPIVRSGLYFASQPRAPHR